MGFSRNYSKGAALTLATLAKFAYYKQDRARIQNRLSQELGLELATFVNDQKSDTEGLIAHNRRTVAIAFRGTESVKDVVTDIGVVPKRVSYGGRKCRVHAGFHRAYRSIASETEAEVKRLLAERPRRVFVTGHSLGAGLATLCAFSLATRAGLDDIVVYTFGSPRVGDRVFADFYEDTVGPTYRVRYMRDVVTTWPKKPFEHVGQQKIYDSEGRLVREAPARKRPSDHKLANYLKALGK